MRTQKIYFPDQQTFCVFPNEPSSLAQAISELRLKVSYPVIVLIGGAIDEHQAGATQRAIQTISRIAEDMNAVVICGGTDLGVIAEIGQIRRLKHYKFPLIGIAPEDLVAWRLAEYKVFMVGETVLAIRISLLPFHPCARQSVWG